MRLHSWVVAMTALLTAIPAMADTTYGPPRTGGNYGGPRWYGYFFNNGLVQQNQDHTNITMIGAVKRDEPHGTQANQQQGDATAIILAGLQEALDNGEQAMVDVEAIVFAETSSNDGTCYGDDSTAAQDFKIFLANLEHPPKHPNVPYLIPDDPVHSTVSSFYIADEPDRSCNGSLDDQIGLPNWALSDAINAIRQNADTANFPLATIVTKDYYSNMPKGLGLFDWVGMDDYHYGVDDYLNDFEGFEGSLQAWDVIGGTPQKYFLVPLVTYIGDSYSQPYSTGAQPIQSKFVADDAVIGVMPFQWNGGHDEYGDPLGMVGMPWASSYIAVGDYIVALPAPPPSPPPPPAPLPPPPSQQTININIIVTMTALQGG